MTSFKHKKTSWDSTWEKIFKSKTWGRYPPEELVRFISRNFGSLPMKSNIKILDLGCGTGACSWYLSREGYQVFGIDGSETAISIAKDRLESENLNADFYTSDFVHLDFPDFFFDCVIDINAIQHNKPVFFSSIFNEIYRVLKENGCFFSILQSKNTKLSSPTNIYHQNRFIHSFTECELSQLLSRFSSLVIDESTRTDKINSNFISNFIVQAAKESK